MKWRATTGSKSLKTLSDGGYRSCFQVEPDAKKKIEKVFFGQGGMNEFFQLL